MGSLGSSLKLSIGSHKGNLVTSFEPEDVEALRHMDGEPPPPPRSAWGASSPPRSVRRSAPPVLEAKDAGSMVVSTPSGGGGRRWHARHCSDADICSARRMQDVFDSDGAGTTMGKRASRRLYPTQIFCDSCSAFIVDRSGESTFYFCSRCRRGGHSLWLCHGCHRDGQDLLCRTVSIASVASRSTTDGGSVDLGSSRRSFRSLSKGASDNTESKVQRSVSKGSRSSKGSKGTTQNAGPIEATPSSAIPSGAWKGEFTELRSRRPAMRQLTFLADGGLKGSGEDGCPLAGSFIGRSHSIEWGGAGAETAGALSRAPAYAVKWVESYPWGNLEVCAKLAVISPKKARMEGTFVASDGGRGSLRLSLP